jgi:hypothetical protein
MQDETLTDLLHALAISPQDTCLVAVIADRLEETDHPAGMWWRRLVSGARQTTVWKNWQLVFRDGRLRNEWCEYDTPGIRDLCQRLAGITP